MIEPVPLGATFTGTGTVFNVWAPLVENVKLHVLTPKSKYFDMKRVEGGYWQVEVPGTGPGTDYKYLIDGREEYPDPASRYQPGGVHGPSSVVSNRYDWRDEAWKGIPSDKFVIYEIHIGTFSSRGTFEGASDHLGEMADLGITAVELMPVAQFPGTRNWGYDGTYPYAVQNSYGGPEGLKTFVNECHRRGLAVILDVVYNHIGPEGNYTGRYGPYFTNTYKTPWGAALNFDGPYSDQVRRFFIDNALFWITEYHIDALRLDAVHAIFDSSAYPFLRQLADAFHTQSAGLGRNTCLIAESVDNDARLTSQQIPGGLGMDCQWNDDFHHSLHVMLTGESQGYYQDFGGLQQLSKAYEKGFVYDGQYSKYRKRQHGVSSGAIPGYRLVVFSQNHDQVGNRAGAERLASLVPFEALKLAAAACILSPFLPLIFMGEEFAATSPFYYFVSHSDPGLIQAVRKGRREEFASFDWRVNPPDPNDPGTFECSRLIRDSSNDVRAEALRSYYKELIKLRFEVPALARLEKTGIATCCSQDGRLLTIWRTAPGNRVLILLNFGQHQKNIEVESGGSKWKKLLDSSDSEWGGGGQTMPEYVQENEKHMIIQPYNFCIYSEVQLG